MGRFDSEALVHGERPVQVQTNPSEFAKIVVSAVQYSAVRFDYEVEALNSVQQSACDDIHGGNVHCHRRTNCS